MKIPDSYLYQPPDVATAVALLAEHKGKVLAGGSDLFVDLKQDLVCCEHLVSITHLGELAGIAEHEGGLKIGAVTTINQLAESPLVKKVLPALADAAFSMASYQVRNIGTVGGNICSAVPSADLPPALIAADGLIVLRGPDGERTVPLREFFTGPRRTVRREDEIATHVIVPALPPHTGVSYQKFKLRGANALAVAGVAARLTLDGDAIAQATVVLGAVAPIPMVAPETAATLVGQQPTEALFAEAATVARREARPISDVRGSAEYRRELIEVLTRRALSEALARARGE